MRDNFTLALRGSVLCGTLLGAAMLLGCSSDGTSSTAGMMPVPSSTSTAPPPASGAGHDEFVKNMFPLMAGCAGCHVSGAQGAPKFMGADAESTYALIKMNKGVWQPADESSLPAKPDHEGKALDAAGKAEAKKWLDLEFPPEAMGSGGGTTTPSPSGGVTGFNAAIQEFIKCMRQDDWEQNMKFFPMTQTDRFGVCAGCHADGNGGTYLNADFNVTFDHMKTVPFVYRLVSAEFDGGQVSDLIASDRLITKGQSAAKCFDPNNVICHDTYIIPKAQSEGLEDFQSRTLTRIRDLKCAEP